MYIQSAISVVVFCASTFYVDDQGAKGAPDLAVVNNYILGVFSVQTKSL